MISFLYLKMNMYNTLYRYDKSLVNKS